MVCQISVTLMVLGDISSTTQKCQYLASLYVLFIEACLLESFALFGGSKMLAL